MVRPASDGSEEEKALGTKLLRKAVRDEDVLGCDIFGCLTDLKLKGFRANELYYLDADRELSIS